MAVVGPQRLRRRTAAQLLPEWAGHPATVGAVLAHVVLAAVLLVRSLGWLQGLELDAYDRYLRLSVGAGEPDPRIVLVGFTDADVVRFDHPFSDELMATLLERLASAGARAVGLDLIRDVPVKEGYERLAAVLREHGSIVGVTQAPTPAGTGFGPPPAIEDPERIAAADMVPDPDGSIRRGLLAFYEGDEERWSLAARMARRWLDAEGIYLEAVPDAPGHLRLGRTTLVPLQLEPGAYTDADLGGFQFLLTYPGGPAPFETLSFERVLGPAPDLAPAVRDRIVLVGSMSPQVKDYFETPIRGGSGPGRTVYGAALHGHVASQLIRQALGEAEGLRPAGRSVDAAWIWLWCVAGGAAGVVASTPMMLAAAVAGAAAALLGGAFLAFQLGWWLAVVPPLFGLLGAAALTTGYARHWERGQGRALRQLFEVYVSTDVAGALWAQRRSFLDKLRPRPEPRIVTATVLFSDVRGFTTICEAMASEPLRLHDWLNEYMEAMVEVVLDHGGLIEKFAGDGLTVAFGPMVRRKGGNGPPGAGELADDARRAVACAVAMGERLHGLNDGWRTRDLPEVGIRVGIHTGPLVVGSVGGARRMQYTLIGDTANTAARLESYEKDAPGSDKLHCRILISEATYVHLNGRYGAERFGELTLRNKLKRVTVYRITGRGAADGAGDGGGVRR